MPQVASDAPAPAPKPVLPPTTRPAPSSGPDLIFDSLVDNSTQDAPAPPPAQTTTTSQTNATTPTSQTTSQTAPASQTPQEPQTPRAAKTQRASKEPQGATGKQARTTTPSAPVARPGPAQPAPDADASKDVSAKGTPRSADAPQTGGTPQATIVVQAEDAVQPEVSVTATPEQTTDNLQIDLLDLATAQMNTGKTVGNGKPEPDEGLGAKGKTADASKSDKDANSAASTKPAVDVKSAVAAIQAPAAMVTAPISTQPTPTGPAPAAEAAAVTVQAVITAKIPSTTPQSDATPPAPTDPTNAIKGPDSSLAINPPDFSGLQDTANKQAASHKDDQTQGSAPHASADNPPLATTNTQPTQKIAADTVQPTTLTTPNVTSTATSPTTPAAPPAPSATQAVAVPISGVAVQIATMAQAGKNRFEIRLDPPELGRIDVRLDVDRDGHVTSRLIADRSDTLNLLRNDSTGLQRALQDAGLKTADNGLQFSLRDQTMSGGQQNPTPNMPTPTQIVVQDTTAPAGELPQSIYSRLADLRGGVDIRV